MSLYQQQKADHPPIEALIEKHLSGAHRRQALQFLAFMRENRMSPQWGSSNSYNFSSKGRRVCILKLQEDGWQLWMNTQYNEDFNRCFSSESEETRQFLRDTLVYCYGCGSCKPGIDIDILGYPVKGGCLNPVIRLENPDENKLALARKLALLRKQAISEGKAPRVTYIAKSKRPS